MDDDPHKVTREQVESALAAISSDDYDDWIVGVRSIRGAVAREQVDFDLDTARAIAREWSQGSKKFDAREFDYKWTRGCRKDAIGRGRGIGSLFHLAKEHGWKPPPGLHFKSDKPRIIMVVSTRAMPTEVDLDTARAQIADLISGWCGSAEIDWFNKEKVPADRLAIRATPGVGKSYGALVDVKHLQSTCDQAGAEVLYEVMDWHGQEFEVQKVASRPYVTLLVPNLKLADQLCADALSKGVDAIAYRGRDPDPESAGHCPRYTEIVDGEGGGPGWYSKYCHAKTDEGEDKYCPHYPCPYIEQRNTDAFLRIAAHNYLWLDLPQALDKPMGIICDELPGELVKTSAIKVAEIKAELPDSEHGVVDRILQTCSEYGLGDYDEDVLGCGWYDDLDDDLDRLEQWELPDDEPKVDPSQDVAQILKQIASHTSTRRARQFRAAALRLRNEEGERDVLDAPPEFMHTAWIDDEQWVMYQKPHRLPKGHLLMLSGSIDALTAYQLGMKHVGIDVHRNEICTQLYGYSASMTKVNASKTLGPQVALLAELTGGAVITYRDAPFDKDMHFGQVEGLNDLQDRPAVIVVGRVEVRAHEIERTAKGMAGGFWAHDPYRYRYEWVDVPGTSWAVRARTLQDGEHYRRMICEKQLDQAADRIRSVGAEETKHVFFIGDQPADRRYHVVVSWDEIRQGLRVRAAFARLGTVLPNDPKFLAKRFPDLWETEAAARLDLDRYQDPVFHEGRELAHRPGLTIHPVTRYEYRRTGQRGGRASIAWSWHDEATTREMLCAALGQDVAIV